MGQGRAARRRGLLSLLLAAVLPGAVAAAPPAPLRYRLEAKDGIPGAVRVVATLDRTGPWTIESTWTGRGLAGLWIEDDAGRALRKLVGASPLSITVDTAEFDLAAGRSLRIRFAPTTARGVLSGELVVLPPPDAAGAATEAAAGAPPAEGAGTPPADAVPAFTGPGRCLASAFADDAPGRALRELATALETARPEAAQWASHWSQELVRAAGEVEKGGASRGAIDKLWSAVGAGTPPDPAVAAAFRRVLATFEELTRRERQGGTKAAGRRAAVVHALECLAPAS